MYFGGSLLFTAASAVAIARNPAALRLVSQGGWKVGHPVTCKEVYVSHGLVKKPIKNKNMICNNSM
jgi:hypothetical protein